MDELEFFKGWPGWLRWLLVLPVAFGSALLIGLMLLLMNNPQSDVAVGPSIVHFFMSGAFVGFGALTAPHYRKAVAAALGVAALLIVWLLWLPQLGRASILVTVLALAPYAIGVGSGVWVAFESP